MYLKHVVTDSKPCLQKPGYDSEQFEQFLVKEKSILVAPGKPFGENGNRYVRISLALDDQQLDEAAIRLTELAYLYE